MCVCSRVCAVSDSACLVVRLASFFCLGPYGFVLYPPCVCACFLFFVVVRLVSIDRSGLVI